MLNALKGLAGSKKFLLAVLGSAICGGMSYAGISPEMIAVVGGLFGVTIGAQGAADFGKVAKGK